VQEFVQDLENVTCDCHNASRNLQRTRIISVSHYTSWCNTTSSGPMIAERQGPLRSLFPFLGERVQR